MKKKTDIRTNIKHPLKKGVARIKHGEGYLDVQKVLIKHLNRDYAFTEDIIKNLISYKLFPTIYDWQETNPWVAKHELLLLIENIMSSWFTLHSETDRIMELLVGANLVIDKFRVAFNNAPDEVKEWVKKEALQDYIKEEVKEELKEGEELEG